MAARLRSSKTASPSSRPIRSLCVSRATVHTSSLVHDASIHDGDVRAYVFESVFVDRQRIMGKHCEICKLAHFDRSLDRLVTSDVCTIDGCCAQRLLARERLRRCDSLPGVAVFSIYALPD